MSEYVYQLILKSEPNTCEEYFRRSKELNVESIFTSEEYKVYENNSIYFRVVIVYFKLAEIAEKHTKLSQEEIGIQIGAGLHLNILN